MKQDELDLRQALDYIDPRELSYSEWVGVGMGLKEAGYPVGLWEDWSRRDGGRYRTGECARKWDRKPDQCFPRARYPMPAAVRAQRVPPPPDPP